MKHLYVDMDGVTCNLVKGLCCTLSSAPDYDRCIKEWPRGEYDFAKRFGGEIPKNLLDMNFWCYLEPLPLLEYLIHAVDKYRVKASVLTDAGFAPYAFLGKRSWCRGHLPESWGFLATTSPKLLSTVSEVGPAKDKILIDDHDVNIDSWAADGGTAILVPAPWNRRHAEFDQYGTLMVVDEIREALFDV